jgi:hypothetical protein
MIDFGYDEWVLVDFVFWNPTASCIAGRATGKVTLA